MEYMWVQKAKKSPKRLTQTDTLLIGGHSLKVTLREWTLPHPSIVVTNEKRGYLLPFLRLLDH